MIDLKQIFAKYNADKGYKHRYDEVYEPLFAPNRDKEINFLEIGIWKGLGMQALIDYFPNGQIYGADIFKRLTPADVPVLLHPRAHYLHADSTKPDITSLLESEFGVKFDYILDDGAHWPTANKLTFRHCVPMLKPGGLFIIEDVFPLERMSSAELNHPWIKKHPDRYGHQDNEMFLNELEQSGMSIERFDQRHVSGEPDSYVITLRKDA
jgi:SAM-dependent methyltransferase